MFFLFFRPHFARYAVGRIDFQNSSDEQQDNPFVVYVFDVVVVARRPCRAEQRQQEVVGGVDHQDAREDEQQVGNIHDAFQTTHHHVVAFVYLHRLDNTK